MRLVIVSIVCVALTACSGGPFLYANSLPNISGAADPYPADYVATVSAITLAPGETAMMSQPKQGTQWSIRDPMGWYVCVQHGDRTEVVLIQGGKPAVRITEPPAGYCDDPASLDYKLVVG